MRTRSTPSAFSVASAWAGLARRGPWASKIDSRSLTGRWGTIGADDPQPARIATPTSAAPQQRSRAESRRSKQARIGTSPTLRRMVTEPRTREAAGAAAASRRVVPDVGAVAPDIWLISAATLVAAVLRFATITSQSFWIDEASTVHEVGLSLGSMLHAVRLNETTPQLYFVIAWVWTRIFGGGELGIRSLSAVAGVALVPVLYLCGRELVSRRAGVAAAALAAFNPFLIWYSQEARSYMLLGLLSGLSLLFCARAIRTRARRDVVAWGACSALAILTHFFAAFLIVPEALWILWQLRSREAVLVAGAVAAIQLAILPLAIADTVRPFPSILAAPLSVRLEQVPVTFAASQLYESSVTWGAPGAAILLAIVGALLWLGADPAERRGARRAAAIAAVTLLMPVAFAAVGHDYVFARNLLPAWIPLAVLLGAACAASRACTAGMAFGVALIALFLWAGAKIDSSPAYQRPD